MNLENIKKEFIDKFCYKSNSAIPHMKIRPSFNKVWDWIEEKLTKESEASSCAGVVPKIAVEWTHKIGDKVIREIDIYKPQLGIKRGIVIDRYSKTYPSGRHYPELYTVEWEDNKIESGFLAHGIR